MYLCQDWCRCDAVRTGFPKLHWTSHVASPSCGLVRVGVMQCGGRLVVWCGEVWCGVVWYGVTRCLTTPHERGHTNTTHPESPDQVAKDSAYGSGLVFSFEGVGGIGDVMGLGMRWWEPFNPPTKKNGLDHGSDMVVNTHPILLPQNGWGAKNPLSFHRLTESHTAGPNCQIKKRAQRWCVVWGIASNMHTQPINETASSVPSVHPCTSRTHTREQCMETHC